MRSKTIDFKLINRIALGSLENLLQSWTINGRKIGSEWVALNPKRNDSYLGSFSINLNTGRWGDFSIGKFGGDPISLYAYLFDLKQIEAAKKLSKILGVK